MKNEVHLSEDSMKSESRGYKDYIYIIIITILLILLLVLGLHLWRAKSDLRKQDTAQLINESTSEEGKTGPAANTSFYKTKGGELTLTLPDPYVLVVEADGNVGGAWGAFLAVGKKDGNNAVHTPIYQWTKIEVSLTTRSLEEQASYEVSLLGDDFENVKTSNATVGSLPAKLITANGFGYAGIRRIYVVNSGSHSYKFISRESIDSDGELLRVALDNAEFGEVYVD